MGWKGDQYFYSKRTLRTIAENYPLSDGLPTFWGQITNPWALAEYKADFDMALNSIGRGRWVGLDGLKFKDYRYYGMLQQIVIADIFGVSDEKLVGFYNTSWIPRLRSYAYFKMMEYLNGEKRRIMEGK